MNLEQKIEAILFWRGEPITLKKLAQILEVDIKEVEEALIELEKNFSSRGIVLMRKEDEITLGTSPFVSNLIEGLTKGELERDLGKAGLETLSIVLYRGPIRRVDIDYIRGVNSSFILRNLLIRGLVERINAKEADSTTDNHGSLSVGRGFLYKPTLKLLSFLGITNIHEMPEYDRVREEIKTFEKTMEEDLRQGEGLETTDSANNLGQSEEST